MAGSYKTITETPGWLNRLTGDGVPDSNASLYKSVPYLYRLIQLRCDVLSSVPVKIWKLEDEDEAEEQAWPYPTSLSDLLWKWEAGALMTGAAYGEIIRNASGYQKDVRYRNPFDMQVEYKDGIITVKQNSTNVRWSNDIYHGEYEMVYMPEYDPAQDILPGVGAGKAANVDAKLLYSLAKFPEMYFEGGAMPVTLLGIDSSDRNEIQRVENWFKRSATAIKNAFRVLGIRAGSITPTTLTPLLKDLAMPELNDEAKHNLAVAFGVPKTMMDSEAANYATAKEDRLSFYEDTIKPRARKYTAALNEQLLEKEGLRIEFAFNELDIFQEDESERADLLTKFKQAGLPTRLALDLAGYELSDDQAAMLNVHQEQLDAKLDGSVSENSGKNSRFDSEYDEQVAELRKWQKMAEKRVKDGRPIREFQTEVIEPSLRGAISGALETVKTVEDVKRVFEPVIEWRGYP